MGTLSSRQQPMTAEEIRLYNQALYKRDARLRLYNFYYHGPYHDYLRAVEAQFELDLMPDNVKYGPNYDPKNDPYVQ
jgi:hypothetical protein